VRASVTYAPHPPQSRILLRLPYRRRPPQRPSARPQICIRPIEGRFAYGGPPAGRKCSSADKLLDDWHPERGKRAADGDGVASFPIHLVVPLILPMRLHRKQSGRNMLGVLAFLLRRGQCGALARARTRVTPAVIGDIFLHSIYRAYPAVGVVAFVVLDMHTRVLTDCGDLKSLERNIHGPFVSQTVQYWSKLALLIKIRYIDTLFIRPLSLSLSFPASVFLFLLSSSFLRLRFVCSSFPPFVCPSLFFLFLSFSFFFHAPAKSPVREDPTSRADCTAPPASPKTRTSTLWCTR